MGKIDLKDLTEKQRRVWQMRYQYGWRIRTIAIKMGVTTPAVVQLIKRAEMKAGLFRTVRVRIIRRKPRFLRTQSLSTAFDY